MPVRFKSVRYLRWSVGPIAACSLFGCLAAVRTVKVAPEECTQLEPVSVEAPCPGMRDGLSQRERLACVSEGEMVLRGAAEEAKADTITGVRGQVDDDGYWRGTADAFRCGPVEPERTEAEIPRFKPGLGVAFGGDITRGLGLTSARVPIVYGPPEAGLQLRVEPELGLLHVNGDVEAKITQLGGTIALGAWRDRTLLSGGVRSGVILLHEGELDRTDFRVGVVAGGEYFPSARFSLGAEVYLDYTKTGSWKQAGKTTQSSDSSTVFLGGALAARFYWF